MWYAIDINRDGIRIFKLFPLASLQGITLNMNVNEESNIGALAQRNRRLSYNMQSHDSHADAHSKNNMISNQQLNFKSNHRSAIGNNMFESDGPHSSPGNNRRSSKANIKMNANMPSNNSNSLSEFDNVNSAMEFLSVSNYYCLISYL